jgi:ribosomal protein S12 methylthiotransferase accessory factor
VRFFDRELGQPKLHRAGTHRSRSPRATLEAYLPLAPTFGITRLANVTGLDYVGVPVYQCVRPNSRTLSVSQGKGVDLESAKASALMESIESWHAETMAVSTRFESPELLASHAEIVDLTRLQRASPRRIEHDLPLPWVEGFDIARKTRVFAPYELVDLNRIEGVRCPPLFQSSSNGLASGNHLLEAISHGLCEVIERDAYALWLFDSGDSLRTANLMKLDTIEDPASRQLIEKFHDAGLFLAVYDTTSDVGIPCYQCLLVDPPESFRPLGPVWGFGCHPAPEIALIRALTETAQVRLTRIAGARDDLTYAHYAPIQPDDPTSTLAELLAVTEGEIDFRARQSLATATFEGDVEVMLERLYGAGCESVVVVDLTHPKLGIPVVKVIVPGLEGVVTSAKTHVHGARATRALAHAAEEQ